MTISIKDLGNISSRFDISTEEAERIAETVSTEREFVTVWENTDWWTDENNENTPAQYRFDSGLEQIFEYDKGEDSYIFLGTYVQYGVSRRMTEAKKIARVEEEKEDDDLRQNS